MNHAGALSKSMRGRL